MARSGREQVLNVYRVALKPQQRNARRFVMKLTLIMTLTLLASACTTIGPINTDQACAGWEMIKGTPKDASLISDRLAISIDAHNRQGKKLGCW